MREVEILDQDDGRTFLGQRPRRLHEDRLQGVLREGRFSLGHGLAAEHRGEGRNEDGARPSTSSSVSRGSPRRSARGTPTTMRPRRSPPRPAGTSRTGSAGPRRAPRAAGRTRPRGASCPRRPLLRGRGPGPLPPHLLEEAVHQVEVRGPSVQGRVARDPHATERPPGRLPQRRAPAPSTRRRSLPP